MKGKIKQINKYYRIYNILWSGKIQRGLLEDGMDIEVYEWCQICLDEKLVKTVYQSSATGVSVKGRSPMTSEGNIPQYMRERTGESRRNCGNRETDFFFLPWQPLCRGTLW